MVIITANIKKITIIAIIIENRITSIILSRCPWFLAFWVLHFHFLYDTLGPLESGNGVQRRIQESLICFQSSRGLNTFTKI